MLEQDVEKIIEWQGSIFTFIKDIWGLVPQRRGQAFIKGKHITWQQVEILLRVERAIRGEASNRISVSSGHGVGKTAVLCWIILWYLFCFLDSQVPCTAPSSQQMHDILWKELSIWLKRMPKDIQDKFEWQTSYVRVTENPEAWFARARTAKKENPEALAGVHGDHVLFAIDEASGVPEEIYNTAEGSLTGENVFVIMISNPTSLLGYFYDSHHGDKKNWQTLKLNSEESPIVEEGYIERIAEKHGEKSDEYRIRVKGVFPREDSKDDKGYVPLLMKSDIKRVQNDEFVGKKRLGVDVAGEGDDKSAWVVRDRFRAEIVDKELKSTPKSVARKTLSVMRREEVLAEDTTIDSFGEGADAIKEIALEGKDVNGVNVGRPAKDPDKYINIRAEAYWALKQWIRKGGELVDNTAWDELLTIRYKRQGAKIKIMSKEDMGKAGIPSPDFADALMFTFVEPDDETTPQQEAKVRGKRNERTSGRRSDLGLS